MSKFVRLKPNNPRRGFVVQRHGIGEMFFLGGVRPNWYEVSDDVAATLEQKRQFHTDPDSKPLFDIMSKEEKERVAVEEQNQVLAQLGAIGQTVAMPPELREPRTVDMVKREAEKVAASAVAVPPPPVAASGSEAMGGRADAIPQTRSTRRKKTRGGSVESAGPVTTSDLNGGTDGVGEG